MPVWNKFLSHSINHSTWAQACPPAAWTSLHLGTHEDTGCPHQCSSLGCSSDWKGPRSNKDVCKLVGASFGMRNFLILFGSSQGYGLWDASGCRGTSACLRGGTCPRRACPGRKSGHQARCPGHFGFGTWAERYLYREWCLWIHKRSDRRISIKAQLLRAHLHLAWSNRIRQVAL